MTTRVCLRLLVIILPSQSGVTKNNDLDQLHHAEEAIKYSNTTIIESNCKKGLNN